MSSTSDLTFAQANEIVLDQIEKMSGEIKAALQKTVDPRGRYDGTIDRASTRNIQRTWRSSSDLETTLILTYGVISVNLSSSLNPPQAMSQLSFQYQLPMLSDRNQPLFKNSIERSTMDSNQFSTEIKLRKCVENRMRALLKGIAEWWAKGYLKDAAEAAARYYSLNGAIGRVKLNAELHRRDCLAAGVANNADGIIAAIRQLEVEMQRHIRIVPELKSLVFNEAW